MTDNPYATPSEPPPGGESALPPAPPPQYAAQPTYGTPAVYGAGSVGKVRGTGVSILLFIVTLGIYGWVWYYSVHEEMKRHKGGDGLGGALALVLAIFVGIVMPYITSAEVGDMYERRGQPKPVSGLTGLWSFPGVFLFFIGPIVWFVKTNGALNRYWESLGATR